MSPDSVQMLMLGLIGNARRAAHELKKDHPDVVFTSGRRTIGEQAHAMATNVVNGGGRDWIKQTYKPSNVAMACQRWIDANPDSVSIRAVAKGLMSVFARFDNKELGKISKHLTGQAFDVRPVPGLQGQLVLMSLRDTVKRYGGVLLEKEGGVVVWHAQF